MSESLSGNLSRISKSASQINRLADEATEQIRALDAYLSSLNLGVSELYGGSLTTGRERNSQDIVVDATYWLAYDRDDNGNFGLVIRADAAKTDKEGRPIHDEYSEELQETAWVRPLDKVSRELRISAMRVLPRFVEQLAKKAEETVESLRGSVEQTQSIVDELKAAIPQPKTVIERQVALARKRGE